MDMESLMLGDSIHVGSSTSRCAFSTLGSVCHFLIAGGVPLHLDS